MEAELVMSFRDDVSLAWDSDGQVTFHLPPFLELPPFSLSNLDAAVLSGLQVLAGKGGTRSQLNDLLMQEANPAAAMKFWYVLKKLGELGIVCQSLQLGERRLATWVPMARYCSFRQQDEDWDQRYVLSRFAYVRRQGEVFWLETPLSPARLTLLDSRTLGIVAGLARPSNLRGICDTTPDLPEQTVALFFALLLGVGAVSPVDADGRVEEEGRPDLVPWEFHDLLFHTRSRAGRHDMQAGGPFRLLGQMDPLPALPRHESTEILSLYKPDLPDLMDHDLPFTRVLELRRSRRDHGQLPIDSRQLGEFLYRAGRVRRLMELDVAAGEAGGRYQYTDRVYPGAGAAYELDLFLCIASCQNLLPGLYYYCPQRHQLHRLLDLDEQVLALLQQARAAMHADRAVPLPQVLITYAARFQRLTWKYHSIAYSLVLKDVGVLQQTMNLVAEAMGLAGCALGCGDSDLFSRILGNDYYFQTSVGEFALGSRAETVSDPDYNPYGTLNVLWMEPGSRQDESH